MAVIAEHLVRTSQLSRKFDPQVTITGIAETTGLPGQDIRLGVLDLADAGFVERSRELKPTIERFWPTDALFSNELEKTRCR